MRACHRVARWLFPSFSWQCLPKFSVGVAVEQAQPKRTTLPVIKLGTLRNQDNGLRLLGSMIGVLQCILESNISSGISRF